MLPASFHPVVTVLFLVTSTGLGHAGRPLTIDDASPVDHGHMEFEWGFTYEKYRSGAKARYLPELELTYGVFKGLELSGNIRRIDRHSPGEDPLEGFEDLHLSAKYRFLNETQNVPAVAVNFDLRLPTASRSDGLSPGGSDEDFNLIGTRHFGPLEASMNFGYTLVHKSRGEALKNIIHGGVAIDWPFHTRWELVTEVYGSSRRAGDAPNEAAFLFGFRLHLMTGLVLDAGMGRSLRHSGNQLRGTAGLTWNHDLAAFIEQLVTGRNP